MVALASIVDTSAAAVDVESALDVDTLVAVAAASSAADIAVAFAFDVAGMVTEQATVSDEYSTVYSR